MKKSETSKRSKKRPLSEMADKNGYMRGSVRCAESEIGFMNQALRNLEKRGQKLGEDFCGSALVSFEWVTLTKDNGGR